MSALIKQISCDRNRIAAYIDGELDTAARLSLEIHLEKCVECRDELRAHRLFICELDSALMQPGAVEVPRDFSRLVAARATSDMSGVRSVSEHKKALAFCAILALTALGLLSESSRVAGMKAARQVMGMVVGTIGVLWTALYDVVASVTVIFRVLSRKLFVESNSLGPLLVLLALAVLLLSRMIRSYHRTGTTE